MSIENIGTSLGIGGILAVALYKIMMAFIRNWAAQAAAELEARMKAEGERTLAMVAGMTSIASRIDYVADRVDAHGLRDIESHGELHTKIERVDARFEMMIERWREEPTPTQIASYERQQLERQQQLPERSGVERTPIRRARSEPGIGTYSVHGPERKR